MGKSSGGTNTVVQQSSPPSQFLNAYENLVNTAQTVTGSQPQAYQGPLVAGFTPQQQQAFSTIENAQGLAQPYYNAAAQQFGQAATPFYQTVGNYISPYTQNVTNALQGLFNQQNAQQLNQVAGNAVSHGAYGGDREAIAEALTAQQQQLAEAPTLANVLQGGYQTGLGAAEAQGWLGQQAGFGLANLGGAAQQSALTGAQAELGAGGLQQQLAQEQLNIPYEQWAQAQAAPYQNLQALEGAVTGTGSLAGGTSSTQYPGPSLISQLGGLGLTGLGLAGSTGGFGSSGWLSGLFGGGAGAGLFSTPASVAAATDIGSVASGLGDWSALGALAAAKDGGRVGLADGGATGNMTLPPVPTLNLDYIAPANPTVKGKGPPEPPSVSGAGQNQGFGLQQGMDFLQGLQKVKGLFGSNSSSASNSPSTSADGGRAGLQYGGETSTPQAGLAMGQLGGAGPNVQGYIQKLEQLPMDQLQNMAARVPAGSSYGQIIQRVLTQRRMTPNAGPGQVSSASGVPIGTGAVPPGTGLAQPPQQQQPMTGGTSNPQQLGLPASQLGLADGGSAEPAHEPIPETPDMDPQPVVDHTGETVVIHYPSEGKSLDLGIPSSPSMRREKRALGGLAPGGSVGSSPVIGTSGAAPFLSALPTGSGIAVPQVSMDLFRDPTGVGGLGIQNTAVAPGGGLGTAGNPNAWMAPLQQYQPPGTGINAQGQLFFPQIGLNSPGMAAFHGGSGSSGSSGTSNAALDQVASDNAAFLAAEQTANANSSGGGKRGGRVGLQGGGDTDGDVVASAPIPPADNSDFIEPPAATGDTLQPGGALRGSLAAPIDLPSDTSDLTPPPRSQGGARFDTGLPRGLASGAGGAGLAGPVGEPAAPEAQTTPDRAPVAPLPRVKVQPMSNEAASVPEGGRQATPEELARLQKSGKTDLLRNGELPTGVRVNSKGEPYAADIGQGPTPKPFDRNYLAGELNPVQLTSDNGLITERTNPKLAQQINAAPAAGEPIPLESRDTSAGAASPTAGAPATVPTSTAGQPPAEGEQHGLPEKPVAGIEPNTWAALRYLSRSEGAENNPWNYRHNEAPNYYTASGYWQITHGNWQDYGPRAGVDVSKYPNAINAPLEDQAKVASLMFKEQGAAPWDTSHGGSLSPARVADLQRVLGGDYSPIGRLAASPAAADQDPLVDQQGRGLPIEQAAYTGVANGAGAGAAASPAYNEAVARILKDIEHHTQSGGNIYNSPWLPVLAAGLGMLASRSPYPGVALGEGGLQGLKMMQEQQVTAPKAQLEQTQADMARLQMALYPEKMRLMSEMGPPSSNGNSVSMPTTAGTAAIPPMAAASEPPETGAALQALAPTIQKNAMASTAAGASAVSPTSGLPVPANYGRDPVNARYDQQLADIDHQIQTVRQTAYNAWRLGLLSGDPEKAMAQQANYQATIARLIEARTNAINNYPEAAGARATAEAWGRVAPAIAEEAGKQQQMYRELRGPGAAIVAPGGQIVAQSPQPVDTIDPKTGERYRTWAYPALAGQQQPGGAIPGGLQQPPGAAAGTPTIGPGAPGQAVPTELGPGERTALETRAREEQTQRQKTIDAAAAAQQAQGTLVKMGIDADKIYTGPLAQEVQGINRYLRLINPSFNEPVASYDDFVKNGGQLTRQTVRQLSSRAAVQEYNLVNDTLPNPTMSPQGLRRVIGEFMGLNDYAVVKAQAQEDWERQHGGIGHVEGFETAFQKNTSPVLFIVRRMPAEEYNIMRDQLMKTPEGRGELQHLAEQAKWLKQSGLADVIR